MDADERSGWYDYGQSLIECKQEEDEESDDIAPLLDCEASYFTC